ncbi:hypothetical protein AB6M97_01655 [Streptococcus hillyeri]|uniref:ATP-binding protein n=1 Tax=Streptococcus hillyeri TaxID=2282420 RepID=A0A3L9DVN4_9STRE|nr:hypothetical protein [Streptococcus hillyeri]RLY03799.1 hypothetical protein EAF07_04505 [Streptococcus hillyeri]
MDNSVKRFPLVADDEPVVGPLRQMALYNDEDLITNIHGDYQDKDYYDVTRDFHVVKDVADVQQVAPDRAATIEAGKSYATQARQEAKRDVKQKRQAFLAKETKKMAKPTFGKEVKQAPTVKLVHVKEELTGLARAARKLHQEQYILAEIPRTYVPGQTTDVSQKPKNSYDFLKKSQIYNYEENQNRKEYQVAQELNLSRFD